MGKGGSPKAPVAPAPVAAPVSEENVEVTDKVNSERRRLAKSKGRASTFLKSNNNSNDNYKTVTGG